MSLGAEEEILLSAAGLPGNDGGPVQQNLDAVTDRQRSHHARVVMGDGDERGRYRGGDGNLGGLL